MAYNALIFNRLTQLTTQNIPVILRDQSDQFVRKVTAGKSPDIIEKAARSELARICASPADYLRIMAALCWSQSAVTNGTAAAVRAARVMGQAIHLATNDHYPVTLQRMRKLEKEIAKLQEEAAQTLNESKKKALEFTISELLAEELELARTIYLKPEIMVLLKAFYLALAAMLEEWSNTSARLDGSPLFDRAQVLAVIHDLLGYDLPLLDNLTDEEVIAAVMSRIDLAAEWDERSNQSGLQWLANCHKSAVLSRVFVETLGLKKLVRGKEKTLAFYDGTRYITNPQEILEAAKMILQAHLYPAIESKTKDTKIENIDGLCSEFIEEIKLAWAEIIAVENGIIEIDRLSPDAVKFFKPTPEIATTNFIRASYDPHYVYDEKLNPAYGRVIEYFKTLCGFKEPGHELEPDYLDHCQQRLTRLSEALATALWREPWIFKCFVLLHGPSGTGKTPLLVFPLASLFEPGKVAKGEWMYFVPSKSPFGIGMLAGRFIIYFDEGVGGNHVYATKLEQSEKEECGQTLKTWISGAAFDANVKNRRDLKTVYPDAMIFMTSNLFPRFDDDTVMDKMLYVPMITRVKELQSWLETFNWENDHELRNALFHYLLKTLLDMFRRFNEIQKYFTDCPYCDQLRDEAELSVPYAQPVLDFIEAENLAERFPDPERDISVHEDFEIIEASKLFKRYQENTDRRGGMVSDKRQFFAFVYKKCNLKRFTKTRAPRRYVREVFRGAAFWEGQHDILLPARFKTPSEYFDACVQRVRGALPLTAADGALTGAADVDPFGLYGSVPEILS